MNIEAFICALNGGEDYELLFTIPLTMHDAIQKIKDVSIIGHISGEDSGRMFVTEHGTEMELQAQGWNPLD